MWEVETGWEHERKGSSLERRTGESLGCVRVSQKQRSSCLWKEVDQQHGGMRKTVGRQGQSVMSSVNDKVTRKPAHLYTHVKTGKKTNLSLHLIYRLFSEIPNTGITFMSSLCIPGETGASSMLVHTSPTKLWSQPLQEPSGMSLKFLVEKSLLSSKDLPPLEEPRKGPGRGYSCHLSLLTVCCIQPVKQKLPGNRGSGNHGPQGPSSGRLSAHS